MATCPPIHPSIHLSICLSILPTTHPLIHPNINPSVHLFACCLSIHASIQSSILPTVHPFSCPLTCSFILYPLVNPCLLVHPSTHATLHTPIHPPIHPPSYSFIHLLIHLPIYLPVHVSVHPFICVSITSRSSGLQVSRQPTHVVKGKDGRWQALLRAFSHTLVCTHGGNTKRKADEMRPRRKLPQASAPSTPLGAHPSLILLLAPHLTQSLHSPRKPFSFPNKLHLSSRQHCVFAKA